MSNKTRLQTNNNNLDVCIAKANSLPNAGGGSVLTANVAFSFNEDVMSLMPPFASVTFTNSSMIPETFEMSFGNNNVYEKTIVVGTIISIFFTYDMGYGDTTTNGSVELIRQMAMGGRGMITFKVIGNSNSSVVLSLQ